MSPGFQDLPLGITFLQICACTATYSILRRRGSSVCQKGSYQDEFGWRGQHIYGSLQELLKDLDFEHQLSRSGVEHLLQKFDVEFSLENGRPRGRKPASLSHEQLAQKIRNERRKRGAVEAELAELKGEKFQGKVSNLWYLRAGLLAPINVLASYRRFLQGF